MYMYIHVMCFLNFQCLFSIPPTQITREDIEQTYGGSDSRSKGYYSTVYARWVCSLYAFFVVN